MKSDFGLIPKVHFCTDTWRSQQKSCKEKVLVGNAKELQGNAKVLGGNAKLM